MHEVTRLVANLPDTLVRFTPANADGVRQAAQILPVGLGYGAAGLYEEPGRFQHRTEYVQLQLLHGPVADAHRHAAPVSFQMRKLDLR